MVLFRTLLVWLLGLPITIFLFLIILISLLFERQGKAIHSIGSFWSRIILGLAGVKVKVSGIENIPKGQPVIFLSNHQGAFDIPALQGYIPAQFRWVAKKSLFKIPIIGWSMTLAGYIGIERESATAAFRSMIAAAKKIKSGTSVLVFPEGTRSHTDELLPFKRGAFMIAMKSAVPIVPMAIRGTSHIMERGSLLIKPANVTINIGKPIPTQGVDEKVLLEESKKAIEAAYHNKSLAS